VIAAKNSPIKEKENKPSSWNVKTRNCQRKQQEAEEAKRQGSKRENQTSKSLGYKHRIVVFHSASCAKTIPTNGYNRL
jgi:hypothetical protein